MTSSSEKNVHLNDNKIEFSYDVMMQFNDFEYIDCNVLSLAI